MAYRDTPHTSARKMNENLGDLDHIHGQLIEDIVGLKKAVQQDREDN